MTSGSIVFAPALIAILAAIAWIDARKMMIPDACNLLLAATGLTQQWLISSGPPWAQGLSAVALATLLWTLRRAHFASTGRVGLGLGDVKMAGAAATWISPWNLPLFVFMASTSALLFALGRGLSGTAAAHARLAFGPFLAAALLTTWLFEQLCFSGA